MVQKIIMAVVLMLIMSLGVLATENGGIDNQVPTSGPNVDLNNNQDTSTCGFFCVGQGPSDDEITMQPTMAPTAPPSYVLAPVVEQANEWLPSVAPESQVVELTKKDVVKAYKDAKKEARSTYKEVLRNSDSKKEIKAARKAYRAAIKEARAEYKAALASLN